MIELILQSPGSTVCGQAVVAMVLGVSLEGACGLFGHRHGTRTRELVKVLRNEGYQTSDHLILKKKSVSFPSRCIVHMAKPRHWLLLWDGVIYDPSSGINPIYPDEINLSSYLELVLPDFNV